MIYLNNNTSAQTINIPYSQPDIPITKEVQSQKDFTVTERGQYNISPDSGFSSMEKVHLTVNTPDTQEAFESGQTYQKSLMVGATITENGDYVRPDGYSGVTVVVDQVGPYNSGYTSGYTDGYSSGYTDGVATLPIITGTSYSYQEGDGNEIVLSAETGTVWSAVTIDASEKFVDGYNIAVDDLEANAVELSVSANGIYNADIQYQTRGYIKKVIVDVPSGGVDPYFHYSGNTQYHFAIDNTTGSGKKLRIRFWLNKWPDNPELSIFEWSGIKFCVSNHMLSAEYEDSHERWYDVDINSVGLNQMEEIVIDSNGEYLRINTEWFGPSGDDYREQYSGYIVVNPDDVGGQDSVYIENIVEYRDDNIYDSVIGITFPNKGLMEKGGNVVLLN